jgi:hypothetical protein
MIGEQLTVPERMIVAPSVGVFRSVELDICYPSLLGANCMEAALASLAAHAEDAIRQERINAFAHPGERRAKANPSRGCAVA